MSRIESRKCIKCGGRNERFNSQESNKVDFIRRCKVKHSALSNKTRLALNAYEQDLRINATIPMMIMMFKYESELKLLG